ncbi:hypothetical protein MtrunA17_Chr2g0298131 [Medicago truncatula]|uniref:Uncharacterized protein n=1 Tax=Medicago truncatula TaxID=3880 RepID=A0A396J5K5_MEDTR|nr:hypothetical protein MtrunA17_Chr2g0298131 [Medicago truncatula]
MKSFLGAVAVMLKKTLMLSLLLPYVHFFYLNLNCRELTEG